MSLKAFHVLFIAVSTLLSAGFGAWAVREYASGRGAPGLLMMGIGSFLLMVGLLWYGKYFLRKLKHISYL